MSVAKMLGTLIGGIVGLAIAALYVSSVLGHNRPVGVIVATVMLGALLGAALGAFIGTADR